MALGAWLPWMSYFAGLVPLRGVIGVNGKLLFAAGVVSVALGGVMLWSTVPRRRMLAGRFNAVLGVGTVVLAAWAMTGVRELTRIHGSNAMLAPRPGAGLGFVIAGGLLVTLASIAAGAYPVTVRRASRLTSVAPNAPEAS